MTPQKTATTDVLRALEDLQAAANAPLVDVRHYPDDMPIGSVKDQPPGSIAHQGDVYLLRLPSDFTGFDKSKPLGSNRVQLVTGDNPGSRHVASGKLTAYAPKLELWPDDKRVLIGCVIVAPERFTVDHPEHGTHSLPAGTYQVGQQLDWATMQRVRD